MNNRNFTKVTDGKEIFNVYYSGGVWIREGTNNYYDEDDWQNNVITAVKEYESLKPGYLYIHKKTGKPYTLIADNFMFKEDGVWKKDLCLYKTLYDNPDGKYFARTREDFSNSFELKNI